MNKYCAYVAGDKNIIYPSIVTFLSIKRYHPAEIDFFIITEKDYANNEQIEICKKNNITIIDLQELSPEKYLKDFHDMKRWPVHVFLNYLAPIYLRNKFGYSYGIKLDYDMLCVSELDLNGITPSSKEIITVLTKVPLTNYLDSKDINKLLKLYKITLKPTEYSCNVGTIVIDLKEYAKQKIHLVFSEAYRILDQNNITIRGETIEQFGFGMIQSLKNITFKRLSSAYNFRPGNSTTDKNEVNIVHYTTVFKPWAELDMEKVYTQTRAMNFSVFSQILFFNHWIEFCNSIGFKNFERRQSLYSVTDLTLILKKIRGEYKETIDNKNQLILHIEKLREPLKLSTNFKISGSRYLQIYLFNTKEVHYEILNVNNAVKVCLHFEKSYIKYKNLLSNFNTLDVFDNVNFSNNWEKGEICYEVSDPRDYELIKNITVFLVSNTKNYIYRNIEEIELI